MDVDLHQLPIPDWGLACPRCDYLLRGLPAHRCPECGLALDMEAIVKPWTRVREPQFSGDERPLPDFGLTCRACHASLTGTPAGTCQGCRTSFDLQLWRPREPMFKPQRWMIAELTAVAIEQVLLSERIPHRAQDRGQSVGELYGFAPPTTSSANLSFSISSDFFFDFLAAMQAERAYWATVRGAGRAASWACPACGEESPGSFTACWSCGGERG